MTAFSQRGAVVLDVGLAELLALHRERRNVGGRAQGDADRGDVSSVISSRNIGTGPAGVDCVSGRSVGDAARVLAAALGPGVRRVSIGSR
jgi:hypothetical protein